jgi:hypothetical protein
LREAIRRLAAALTGAAALPPPLDAAARRLEASAWPEMVGCWSRLTPSGFPIELTVRGEGASLRWTAEAAGPELAEHRRLEEAATSLAEAGAPVPLPLRAALGALHDAAPDLRFGAWIGGREDAPTKLYAELPAGAAIDALPLPEPLRAARLPAGTMPRMLGIEPRRGRVELYLRLPAMDPEDLLPFVHSAGCGWALATLARDLPDGLRRLAGRRLGISLAAGPGDGVELALFASARTLFPADARMVGRLVPAVAGLAEPHRTGLVTLALDPATRRTVPAVGVAPLGPSHSNATTFWTSSGQLTSGTGA